MTDKNDIPTPLQMGQRVRNYGEQYGRALVFGTAVVIDFRMARGRFLEYQVLRDKEVSGIPNPTWWPAHRTIKVDPA